MENINRYKIEILENGVVQVRQATRIVEDGDLLSTSYTRWLIAPGDTYTEQSDMVKAVCALVQTPEVIAAYKTLLATETIA